MTTVGVVLSGCGVYDGAEVHESVITLLALDKAGAKVVCLAPDVELETVDHLTQKPTGERRNVLRESARIARGEVRPIGSVSPRDLDAVIFPGGFGAAKNLSDFAVKGAGASVHPDVARLVKESSSAHLFRAKKGVPGQYDAKPWVGGSKRGWTFLDSFSASAYVAVYDAPNLSSENRAKLEALEPARAISICFKMCK